MPLSPAQLTALRTELATDPRGLGYAAPLASADDPALAALLNGVRDVPVDAGGGAFRHLGGDGVPRAAARPGANPADTATGLGLGMRTDGSVRVARQDVNNNELTRAIVVVDYTALASNPTAANLSAERRYLSWQEMLGSITPGPLVNANGADTPIMTNLRAMFGSGTGTLARMLALAWRHGSRAEELFGPDAAVTPADVGAAR